MHFNLYNAMIQMFSTCFYVGKIKWMPGTCGTLLAFLFLPFMKTNLIWLLGILSALIFGTFTADRYASLQNIKDPKEVVIDELVAQLLVFYALKVLIADMNTYFFILSFILFRVFDILKPFPISCIDEKMEGGIGIMLDDLLAGLFAILLTFAIYRAYLRFFPW